jgi:hypothetical protein
MHRPQLSAAKGTELWSRWKKEKRPSYIATAQGRVLRKVYTRIRRAGGNPERPRQRAAWALSAAEREQIFQRLANRLELRAIPRALVAPRRP